MRSPAEVPDEDRRRVEPPGSSFTFSTPSNADPETLLFREIDGRARGSRGRVGTRSPGRRDGHIVQDPPENPGLTEAYR